MSTQIINHVYKFKRGTEEVLFDRNPLLLAGEPLVVLCDDNIVRLKIGDGNTYYSELPFINKENDDALRKLTIEFEQVDKELRPTVLENKDTIEVLTEDINNEIIARQGSDEALKNAIDAETERATKVEKSIQSNFNRRIDSLADVVETNETDIEAKLQETQTQINNDIKQQLDNLKIQDVNETDKVLSVKNQKLFSTLSLQYDNENTKINLLGKNNNLISSIDVSDFIISGMLEDVNYNPDTNVLTFTWNTVSGLKSDEVLLSNIIDPYEASDGINIDGTTISLHIAEDTEGFLTLSGEGLKLSGVQDAIDALASNVASNLQRLQERVELNEQKIAEHTNLIDQIKNKGYITDEQASDLITDALIGYITSDEVDKKIADAIDTINIDKIDGGRISDGN